MFKRRSQGNAQRLAIEVEGLRQQPYVVEVLHPAVEHIEIYHCLKFLGDRRLDGVRVQPDRWTTKQQWNFDCLRSRMNRISYSKIDLNSQANLVEPRLQTYPRSDIFGLRSNRLDDDGRRITEEYADR